MAFNIENFKSITEKGFLKPSNFLVYVYPPVWAYRDGGAEKWNGPDLAYLAAGAALPGLQIFTTESKLFGQGPTVKMPYDITPTDFTLKFYADGTGKSMAFFYDWLRNIVNLSHTQTDPRSGAFSNQISYRSDYITKIDIMLYNDRAQGLQDTGANAQDGALMIFTLYDAFPISIAEPSLDWQSGNEILTFNITFAYTSFEYKIFKERPSPVATRATGLRGTVDIADPELFNPGPLPKNLTDLPPQVAPEGEQTPSLLSRINSAAKNVRERSQQIRTESVSLVKQIENTIYNNEYISTAKEVVGAVKDVRRTLSTLKGLNASLKKDLKQELKTITSGSGLRGFF